MKMARADKLAAAIEGAQHVKVDKKRKILMVWYGGTGINAYSLETGDEIAHWNMGGPEGIPTTHDAEQSMNSHIQEGYYPC